MKITIKTTIQQEWGGILNSDVRTYVDPKDAVLGLAHQVGIDVTTHTKQLKEIKKKLKILKDALETIVELTDGSQEYNASQFKWAQIYAQDALDKIAK